jgi:hypothetical protein
MIELSGSHPNWSLSGPSPVQKSLGTSHLLRCARAGFGDETAKLDFLFVLKFICRLLNSVF